jgi:alpha-ribazole phosphatase
MEIILIRHTEPDVLPGICYGHTDILLNKTGLENAQKFTNSWTVKIDKIYSSPLKRCSILANMIQEKTNTKLSEDARLMEMNFGNWEMKLWNEINQEDVNKWMIDFENEKVPGGESALELRTRIKSFIEEIKMLDFNKIAIVCHAGSIRTFISILEKISLGEAFKRKIEYGSIIKLTSSSM